MPRKIELQTGQRFGSWTALFSAGRDRRGDYRWTCQCDCGTLRDVTASSLTRGVSKGCGCASTELLRLRRTTHGLSRTSEYSIWRGMWNRCSKPDDPAYKHYGGRGIYVCHQWSKFEQFLADMGHRPGKDLSIEREDNDGPYSPENCTWATNFEQARNKSNTQRITYEGKTYLIFELADQAGIERSTFKGRLDRGWSLDRAMTTPTIMDYATRLLYKNELTPILALVSVAGVKAQTIKARIKRGMTVEQAVETPPPYKGPPRKVSHKKKGSKYWYAPH